MPKEPNLSRLSPRDECLTRVALANAPQDQLRGGLSAVAGPPHGTAIILAPDRSGDDGSGLSYGSSRSNGLGEPEQDV